MARRVAPGWPQVCDRAITAAGLLAGTVLADVAAANLSAA